MRRAVQIQTVLTILLAGAAAALIACSAKRVIPAASFDTPARVLKPAPPSPPTISIMASPSTINKGDLTILIWRAEHATSVRIDGGVGPVEISAKQSVTPSASTTYTATAEGPGGNAAASTRVTVIEEAAVTPAPRRPISDAEFFSTRVHDIFFDFDKYDLRTDSIVTLDENYAALTERPTIHLTIEGHCDERGSEKYNLALGDRRAQVARQYLLLKGVRPDRIDTISYGEQRPFNKGHNEDAWAANRRAHFELSYECPGRARWGRASLTGTEWRSLPPWISGSATLESDDCSAKSGVKPGAGAQPFVPMWSDARDGRLACSCRKADTE